MEEKRKEKKNKKRKKTGGGGVGKVFKRFRSQIILKYTPDMRSSIWSTLMFATFGVILPSRVSIMYVVGACYTRDAGSRRSCWVWGRRGRWRGVGGG